VDFTIFGNLSLQEYVEKDEYCYDPNYRTPSERPLDRALVVVNNGELKVLHCIGPGMDYYSNEIGKFDLEDGEWTNLSNGLLIWEGSIVNEEYWTSCGMEYDCRQEGDFRKLTTDEWFWFKEDPDSPPWDESEWLVGRCTKEEWMEFVHG